MEKNGKDNKDWGYASYDVDKGNLIYTRYE